MGEDMSQETPIILYVGDIETGQWLESSLDPNGGYVYTGTELIPTLGIYSSYMPDLVILDAQTMPDLARQVYLHLRSVDAEPIIILDDNTAGWEYPIDAKIEVLPIASKPDLLAVIDDLIGALFAV
jgi:hypothetical protein